MLLALVVALSGCSVQPYVDCSTWAGTSGGYEDATGCSFGATAYLAKPIEFGEKMDPRYISKRDLRKAKRQLRKQERWEP